MVSPEISSPNNTSLPRRSVPDDFKSIVRNSASALCVISEERVVLFANPAAEKILGHSTSELLGKPFPYPIAKGEIAEIEIRSRAEEITYAEMQVSQTQWQGKTAFLVSLQDISKAKRAQQAERIARQAVEARAAELDMLWFFTETLNQAATLEEALQSGLQTGIGLLNASQGWIFLIDETGIPYLAASHNFSHQLQSFGESDTYSCQCLTQLIKGEITLPSVISECEMLRSAGIQATHPAEHLTIPLRIGNRPVGILNLVTAPGRVYNQDEYRLLKTIGDQFAVAIERARLFAETQAALEREQRLTEVTRTISSALDIGVILANVINLTIDLLKADVGGLGLLIPNTDKIVSPYLFSADKRITALKSLPAGETLARYLIDQGKAISWSTIDINTPHEINPISQELIAAGVYGVIGAPIIAGETRLGALVLYSLSPAKRFIQRYLTLIDSIGRQAGVAIQNARLYEEIQQLATTDPLTGLYNRRAFFHMAQQQIETALRYHHHLSAIMLDIDHFKKVNDTYGHSVGDKVLQRLANLCQEELRQADILCRYGGEEILIIMPGTTLNSAAKAAERLRHRIQETPFAADGETLSITVSLGVATLASPAQNEKDSMAALEAMINNADEALYQSKQAGRNRVTVFQANEEPLSPSNPHNT